MYDKASIALIPSGFKSGVVDNLYSVLPSNGNGDFNHSRSSIATRVNKDGLIESVGYAPRLDYTGNVDCPHLLLEPNRTNLITYSEDFSNGAWLKARSSIVANNVISPDGLQTANKLNDNTDNNSHYIALNNSFSLGSYSASIFAKKGTLDYLYIWFTGFNNVFDEEKVWFNLDSGYVGTTQSPIEASIEDYGNGWYKCTAKSTADVAATGRISFAISNNDNVSSYSGSGSDNIYLWGAQIEEGSYPTSYIPTSGSAETRTADTCNNAGTSAEFNDSEGVLFAEVSTNADSNFKRISIHSGSYVNSVFLDFDNTNNLYGKVIVGGSAVVTIIASGLNIENNNKIALSYKENDFKLFVNGSKVGTDVTGATPTGLNNLAFDLGGGQDFYGKCKQLIYFNEALSDSELQTLTS